MYGSNVKVCSAEPVAKLILLALALISENVFSVIRVKILLMLNSFFGSAHISLLGMFVTTGCSSSRQFVATASRQDTGSRQQKTDSGRQITASGQFYKPRNQNIVIMLYFCYAGLNGKLNQLSMSETSCNFCYLSLLNTSLKVVSKIVENQNSKSCFEISLFIFNTGCPEIL